MAAEEATPKHDCGSPGHITPKSATLVYGPCWAQALEQVQGEAVSELLRPAQTQALQQQLSCPEPSPGGVIHQGALTLTAGEGSRHGHQGNCHWPPIFPLFF